MSKLADQIIQQARYGLITKREARAAMRRLNKQAQFNADYSDTLASYTRWQAESRDAHKALEVLR